MSQLNALQDTSFLKNLDNENIKTFYTKIIVLDRNELPISTIEGRITDGNISVDGSSSVRRSGNLSFIADETENDLTDVDNLLSLNKKIKISIGFENNIDDRYEDIIWFPLGVFVITQPTISHSAKSASISLQLKDKMALLNGDCGGKLPTSVTFDSYEQLVSFDNNGGTGYTQYPSNPNQYTIYLVNFEYCKWDKDTNCWTADTSYKDLVGTTQTYKQRIYDIIQTAVCNFGGELISNIFINDVELSLKSLVHNMGKNTLYYNPNNSKYTFNEKEIDSEWIPFDYNEDCGYIYTDFTYPGSLVTSIGDSVTSVLDKIISVLGNYEYFYDVEGRFIFQEKKNYLNTQYSYVIPAEDGSILNNTNYKVDFSNSSSSIYDFSKNSALITSFSNVPDYSNIKNDFHVWGKNNDKIAIHYHLVIKEKPVLTDTTYNIIVTDSEKGLIRLANPWESGETYKPTDWRAALYMSGLQKQSLGLRPDIYEQELLDCFDSIYNMYTNTWRVDIVNRPNDLIYWFDYIEPLNKLSDVSVDVIGPRIISYQKDNINKLYDKEAPNVIIINKDLSAIVMGEIIARCEREGQPRSNVSSGIYDNLAVGTVGYSAQEAMRELLYKYTNYAESINISCIPIYYLEPNKRITVADRITGIAGDYVIKSMSLPLDARKTMTISATKATERV